MTKRSNAGSSVDPLTVLGPSYAPARDLAGATFPGHSEPVPPMRSFLPLVPSAAFPALRDFAALSRAGVQDDSGEWWMAKVNSRVFGGFL